MSFKEDRGDQFDVTAEERRRQKDNTGAVYTTGVEQMVKGRAGYSERPGNKPWCVNVYCGFPPWILAASTVVLPGKLLRW